MNICKVKIINTILAIAIAATFSACNKSNDDTVLATANGKKLYLADLKQFIPANASSGDSANIISAHVSAWVRRQLLVQQAQNTLSEKQKNVEAEIEDYRSSLLIYRLEQDYILKNMDTTISNNEIEKIYEENKNLFVLNEPVMQAIYIKIQSAAPEAEQIKKIYLSSKPDDLKQTENLCINYADKYDTFHGDWLSAKDLLKLLPANIEADKFESDLLLLKFYEAHDDSYDYMIRVKAILPKGSQSPLKNEMQNIRTMILNSRKRKMINDFESNIYKNGIDKGDAKIETENK